MRHGSTAWTNGGSPPNGVIAYCVSDPGRARIVHDALRGTPYRLISIERSTLVSAMYQDPCPSLLIHDLAPLNSRAVEQIADVRQVRHGMPILLYPPVEPRLAGLLLECGRIPLIHAELQLPGGREDLRAAVTTILASTPAADLWRRMSVLLSVRPGIVRTFIRLALDAAQRGSRHDLHIGQLTAKIGAERRTLERLFVRCALPPPKRVRDWCVFLMVAMATQRMGSRPGQAAAVLGFDARCWERLTNRLLPPRLAADVAARPWEGMSLGVLAFGDECRQRRLRWSRLPVDCRWDAEWHPQTTRAVRMYEGLLATGRLPPGRPAIPAAP